MKPMLVNWDSNPFEFIGHPEDWLYGEWSEDKYNTYLVMDSIKPLHYWMDYLLSKREAGEYLDRYGMDYSDIHDPRKLSTTRSASAAGSYVTGRLNFFSKNIGKLYR